MNRSQLLLQKQSTGAPSQLPSFSKYRDRLSGRGLAQATAALVALGFGLCTSATASELLVNGNFEAGIPNQETQAPSCGRPFSILQTPFRAWEGKPADLPASPARAFSAKNSFRRGATVTPGSPFDGGAFTLGCF